MTISTFKGGRQAFNALVYAPSDPTIMDRLNAGLNTAISATTAMSERFMEGIKSIYDRYSSSAAITASKLLLYEAGGHMNENVIMPYNYDNLGNANLIMQRYIMAEPNVAKLHKRGMCYGFADTYINPEPDTYGEESYLYKSVMDGMLVSNRETEGLTFFSCSHEMMKPLDFLDKSAILLTWDAVALSLMNDCDPTDPDRGDL